MHADSLPAHDDGPLINDCPALTIQGVQSWCHSASMPCLSDDAAAELARAINHLALLRTQWGREFAGLRKANTSPHRMRRIARALATLRDELSALLEDSRRVNAHVIQTEALLDLVQKHSPIIDKFQRAPGRAKDLTVNVATNIGKLLDRLCDPSVSAKARDAFVHYAMAWLSPRPPADDTIARNRRRRTKSAHPNRLSRTQ
jgi:hypothetical protein